MNKKTVIIIVLAILMLFLVVVGGGFYFMWNKLSKLNPQGNAPAKDAAQEEPAKEEIGALFPLDTFIVNLGDTAESRYLKIEVSLELKTPEAVEEMNKRLPQIRDLFLTTLPTKKSEELQSVEGKQALKNEIIGRLNTMLGNELVSNIYFTDFVIQ